MSSRNTSWQLLEKDTLACLSSMVTFDSALSYQVTLDGRAENFLPYKIPDLALDAYMNDVFQYDPVHFSHFSHDARVSMTMLHRRQSQEVQPEYQEFIQRWAIGDTLELFYRKKGILVAGVSLVREKGTPLFSSAEIERIAPLHQLVERSLDLVPDDVQPIVQSMMNGYGWTRTEAKVVSLLCEGHCNKIIARQLLCSLPTVKTHLQNIYRKSGIHNRQQLMSSLLLRH